MATIRPKQTVYGFLYLVNTLELLPLHLWPIYTKEVNLNVSKPSPNFNGSLVNVFSKVGHTEWNYHSSPEFEA